IFFDELGHLAQLALRRSRQIQNRNVHISRRQKRLRFGEFGSQIQNSSHTRANRLFGFAFIEFPPDQDTGHSFIPGPALSPVIKQRKLLAQQNRTQRKFCAQWQRSIALAENARSQPEVTCSNDTQGDRGPEQQTAPGPKYYCEDNTSNRPSGIVSANSQI